MLVQGSLKHQMENMACEGTSPNLCATNERIGRW
jgi:hypothetical protein